ncbi:MAG: phosphodiester glycosidase family protein [Rhizobiaceae bacterium]
MGLQILNAIWDFFASLLCSLLGVCAQEACRDVAYAGAEHVICSYAVKDVSIRLFLNDDDGQPYGGFSGLAADLNATPLMLMNGGMYHDDLNAVGLYVEQGNQSKSISTKGGWGNFHLLPNGVFWVKDGQVGITETKAFIKQGIEPDFATQSGPMLVINNKLHPRFLKHSDSRKVRNGVGISADGRKIHFAISKGRVTFWEFGNLFKDHLKTPNALFLDGTVSAIKTKNHRRGGWRQIGPIIAVFAR